MSVCVSAVSKVGGNLTQHSTRKRVTYADYPEALLDHLAAVMWGSRLEHSEASLKAGLGVQPPNTPVKLAARWTHYRTLVSFGAKARVGRLAPTWYHPILDDGATCKFVVPTSYC